MFGNSNNLKNIPFSRFRQHREQYERKSALWKRVDHDFLRSMTFYSNQVLDQYFNSSLCNIIKQYCSSTRLLYEAELLDTTRLLKEQINYMNEMKLKIDTRVHVDEFKSIWNASATKQLGKEIGLQNEDSVVWIFITNTDDWI